MKRILVALDGSTSAAHALELAVVIARRFDASLTVINVFSPFYLPPDPSVVTDGRLEALLRKDGEECARAGAVTAREQGLRAEWVAICGAPAPLILEQALARKADLVVVGSRGHGALGRALLGSVSSQLAHTCTLPLLIVH